MPTLSNIQNDSFETSLEPINSLSPILYTGSILTEFTIDTTLI